MSLNLIVTDLAQEKLSSALVEEPADAGIRLAVQKLSPVALHYELEIISEDAATEDDLKLDVGVVKFWIDTASAKLLEGTTIDYLQGAGGEGFKFTNPNDLRTKKWDDPVASRFQKLLEEEINPGVASHGGVITLVDYRDGIAAIHMGGGCQGCGQAGATLQDGVEARVKEVIPEILKIVDATDHDSGENPYY